MFTGIVEEVGRVAEVQTSGTNRVFWVQAALAGQLKVDQSVAHNGVCLTVEELRADAFRVTVIAESLSKTALGSLEVGSSLNLERCLRADARVDGHFVQGHVDVTGRIEKITDRDGSHDYWISYPSEFATLLIPRGSIAVNGISLTVAELADADGQFKVSIIPFTLQHTNLGQSRVGDLVNLEFDLLGKYAVRAAELRAKA